ncbi:efflux transporter outer membrane subunit [Duganella aquatilis]|uniref:efflux transporter outer membrane subunit n=1 Tax=Duganella aquatilis TaxID=2666082 RepID=UPI001E5C779D|nr:efflux transporter outer membrane subunit [Duganella aquatilis]
MHKSTPALLATWLSLMAGCASHDALRPLASLQNPDALAAGATVAAAAAPAAWPARDWWRRYGDVQLDQLAAEALAGHPSMRIAAARVRQAQAVSGLAASALAPQVNGGARSNRQKFSDKSTVPPPLAGSWTWYNEATLNFSYELDFWGKNQAAVAAALGRQRAAEVEAEAARLVLMVGVTQSYLRLAQLHAQRDLATDILQQRQQVLALTRQRVAARLDSAAELKQAEIGVPQAQGEIVAANEAIQLVQSQLAALLGAGPDRGAAIARPQLAKISPAAVPSGLPSELIARRPDLVAQRWRVEALRRDIAVAEAQFYPSLNLNALVGLQSLGFEHFLEGGSRIAGAGGAFSLPIFDGDRLRSNLKLRDADYDLAVEGYNQSLVEALRDVASQLISIRWLQQRSALQAQATATAQDACNLSIQRYRSGLGNYLQVLAAELQVQAQRRAQIELDIRAYDLDMQLVRALGGGYVGV